MFAVRRKDPVEAGEVDPGPGHQGGQPGDKIERLEDDVRRAVPIWGFQLVADISVRRERQALFRNRRAADVAAQPVLDPEGWYRTGDLGSIDDSGYLRFSARVTDMIKTGGINVAPAEVEDFSALHPAVHDVAVVGAPDSDTGEVVVAFVVPTDSSTFATEELLSYCRERMAAFKVPAQLRVMRELPKTDTGKLERRTLRELAITIVNGPDA